MTDARSFEELEQAAQQEPEDPAVHERYGLALLDRGHREQGAEALYYAARLDRANTTLALRAASALCAVGRHRDVALLLSTKVFRSRVDVEATEDQLAAIEELLHHPEVFVRSHAARAIGRLRLVDAIPALERAAADPDGTIRLAVVTALGVLRAH